MAITEYYVSAAGSGANTGLDASNELTLAQMVTQINGLGGGGGAGRRYNIRGTHSETTNTRLITVGGTAASPLVLRGYVSTITDGYQGRTNDNGPLVTTNFPSISFTSGRMSVATYTLVECLNISATSLNNFILDVGANSLVTSCNFASSGTGGGSARCIRLDANATAAVDCDFSNTCTTAANAVLAAAAQTNRILACRISCTNGPGITVSGAYGTVIGNIIYSSTVGISLTSTSANGASVLIANNTIYNCSTAGIQLPNSAAADDLPICFNNHIQDCGKSIDSLYSATADLQVFWAYNRTDNTSPDSGFTDWQAATNRGNVATATATEYVNAGAGDFNLATGTLGRNAGWPKYASMGALQLDAAAGGGGGWGFRRRPRITGA